MGILEVFFQFSTSISILGATVGLLLVYLVSTFSLKNENDPPGPKPLPLLGNLLQMDLKNSHDTLQELSKKYGSVFTVYLGPKKVVVLAGYKTVKEALVNYAEEFGERDQPVIMHESNQGQGIIWSNGDTWKEMRRFALTNLKDFGMGKRVCEDKIIEECDHLIKVFQKFKGQAFDVTQLMNCAVSNIIGSMVYGRRSEYDDPGFTSMVQRTCQRNDLMVSRSIQVYNLFPWLCKWMANRRIFHNLDAAIRKRNLELFNHLKETFNPQMCRGLVDAFLLHKTKLEESGIANSHFHNDNLMRSVMNLFSAGTDTTSTTLRWGLLLMAKHPKIQGQVQEELSTVIGSRQVLSEDRKNLPFTNAVIHEIQRVGNIAPLALPHKTAKDITFQGFFIKKGTTVFPLLSSVLYDESEWERPHMFYPAHFLDNHGNFVKRDAFLPFSAGQRACPGESLARMELFLFFTTLLQHFCFSPPPGVSEDELDQTKLRLTIQPLSHELSPI